MTDNPFGNVNGMLSAVALTRAVIDNDRETVGLLMPTDADARQLAGDAAALAGCLAAAVAAHTGTTPRDFLTDITNSIIMSDGGSR